MNNHQENQYWQMNNNSNAYEFTPVPNGMLDGLSSNFLILNNSHRNFGEVAQLGTIIHPQRMDSYLHAFVLPNGYSNDYGRVLLMPLQSPHQFHGNGHHHFFSSSNTTMGEINLTQSFQHVPDFLRAMQVVTPFHDARGNIIEHDLQLGMTNHYSNGPPTYYFMNQIANHYGEYIFPLDNLYLSNSTGWTLQSNMYEHGVGMSSGIMNNPTTQIAFQRQSIQIPNYTYSLVSSAHMNPYIDSSITMAQHNFASRPEIHGGGYSSTHFISSLPPSNYETRSEMVADAQVQSTLEELDDHVTRRIEGILDEGDSLGLSEDRVMMHISRGHFEFVEDETIDDKESCCICQEEFANGEEVGKLSCMHTFHVECIKDWLMFKNICPICREVTYHD